MEVDMLITLKDGSILECEDGIAVKEVAARDRKSVV